MPKLKKPSSLKRVSCAIQIIFQNNISVWFIQYINKTTNYSIHICMLCIIGKIKKCNICNIVDQIIKI